MDLLHRENRNSLVRESTPAPTNLFDKKNIVYLGKALITVVAFLGKQTWQQT